jgi:hypothetical protein
MFHKVLENISETNVTYCYYCKYNIMKRIDSIVWNETI